MKITLDIDLTEEEEAILQFKGRSFEVFAEAAVEAALESLVDENEDEYQEFLREKDLWEEEHKERERWYRRSVG